MKNRARIVSGLAALAALFLAPIAEASLSRSSTPARGAPAITLASPASEPSEFSLFEGDELTAATAESEGSPSFHPLAAVSLLDEREQRELATPLETSYPKTRYRVFDFLGAPLLGIERGVSLELHWGCASFSCGFASGTVGFLTEDPLDDIDSPNVYGFVAGRPHEFTDPEGLFSSLNAAKEGAKTLARNLAIIGGIGIVTGFCPPCGAALAIGATGYLAYGVQSDINDRLKQGQNGAQATAGAMGNLTGIGGITEGITNKDFVTGAELNLTDEEREKRVGQGAGNLLSWFAGPKVFKVGAKFGAGARVKFDAWRASENTWPSIKPEGEWEFESPESPATTSNYIGPERQLGPARTATEMRNSPGVATGGERLPEVGGKWLRGQRNNAGVIPRQIADQLRGRSFNRFSELQSEFWSLVADDPVLASGFGRRNLARMRAGRSPFAPPGESTGQGWAQKVYNLHHRTRVGEGGGVYDLDNLLVGTPRYHQSFHR